MALKDSVYYEKVKNDPEYKRKRAQRTRKSKERKRAERHIGSPKSTKEGKAKKKRECKGSASSYGDIFDPDTESESDHTATQSPPSSVTDAVNINKAYRRLFKVRRLLAAWTKEWGAFENWPEAIIDELHTHVEQEKVRIWRAKLIRKIREGKGFLYYVRTAFQRLPHDIDTVRDMWCMACELVQEIQAGVSCMEIHLGLEHEVVFKPVDQTVE